MHEPDSDVDRRTIQSSKLPQVIQELNREDPIIDLDGPESDAQKEFEGTRATPCQFYLCNDTVLPERLSKDSTGIHLSLRIYGGKIAKRVSITAKIAGANIKKLHQSRLEFYPGKGGQIRDFCFTKVDSPPHSLVPIHFSTCGGYGAGLDCDGQEFNDESRKTLQYMQSLTHHAVTGSVNVCLLISDVNGLHGQLDVLQSLSDFPVPWLPYLDTDGIPRCAWLQMPERAFVKERSGGLISFPARNSFNTPTEAHLILANGIALEYRIAPKHDLRSAWPYTERDQIYIQRQLAALEKLFSQDATPEAKEWWPIILNQSCANLQTHDPLESRHATARTPELLDQAWKEVAVMFPWDVNQECALLASRKLPGKVGIIEGAPGSGKTAILAGIAIAYYATASAVILFAPTAAQAKALGGAVTSLLERHDDHPIANIPRQEFLKLYQSESDFGRYKQLDPLGKRIMFSEAKIIVTTPNAICSLELIESFGENSESIIVMHDDAHQVAEPELWATIFSLREHQKVQGLIMTCDSVERPLGIATLAPVEKKCMTAEHTHYKNGYTWMFNTWQSCTKRGKSLPPPYQPLDACVETYVGGKNEFADQIGLCFVTRLLRQRAPSTVLSSQHRCRAALTKVPNAVVYKGLMGSLPPQPISGDILRFQELLRSWLGVQNADKDMSVTFLEASEGKAVCIKERKLTESKRNHRNVDVVCDLLTRNNVAAAVKAVDITIVTQFRDQVRLYEMEFQARAEEMGLSREELPKVVTLDTLRGQQSRVIIYDLVVTCGDKSHGLGIVSDEFRASIAATRATDCLIIVGSHELVWQFPLFWRWMKGRTNDAGAPLPYIVQYATMLLKEGLSFKPPTPKRARGAFKIKRGWIKKEEGFMEWEWSRHHTSGFDKN